MSSDVGIAPNAKRLLWAGFMAILAAGIGFGVRGGILANWASEFGFTAGQLGQIGGAGFTGFCFGIIIGGVIVDKIGYGKLILAAFLFHVVSAFVTFIASPEQSQATAFFYLYWGTFIFALANGTLEAVSNPLVSTLFPNNRTHYLNILHASWPAGLVLGGAIGWFLGGSLSWKAQLGLYLIPCLVYGLMFMGQKFPKSEASAKGLSIGDMMKEVGILCSLVACGLLFLFFKDALQLSYTISAVLGLVLLITAGVVTKFSVGSVLMFVLFLTHVLVGAVELGTDGWIQNITGNILTPEQGKQLFVFTSLCMFFLRFSAHWIEKTLKLSPLGILLICSLFAVVGLNMVSNITSFAGAMLALSIYGIGKTFFWPTMLAVIGDRFPRTGAIAMSIMGGCGMMSAGLLGSAGLGYAKDRFASEDLAKTAPAVYETYKADKSSSFLGFKEVNGLDGAKLGEAQKAVSENKATPEQKQAVASSIQGDRNTLKADSAIPAVMAVIYLLLMLYFKAKGGYKIVRMEDEVKRA